MSPYEGMGSSPPEATSIGAQLRRDFPTLEPSFGGVSQRMLGESRIAVGRLSLTRSRATRDISALPDNYTQLQTAAVQCSDTLRYPRFDLQPANAAIKLLDSAARAMLGIGDLGKVDFTAHPEFSRQYRVVALDTEGTRWLFDEPVLAYLASRPELSISASNGTLLLYRAGAEVSADRLDAFFNEAAGVFRVFEAAARRPGAFNDPLRVRPTDYEFFVEKLGASGAGFKILPAVTLIEADAFLQLPPPREIPPGIARYCKEQESLFVLIFGGLFAMVSGFFLLVGRDQMPWYVQIFLCFGFVVGVIMLIWSLVTRLRIRHLLRHGRTGIARIEAIQTSDSRVDGTTRTRLDLQVEANGAVHRATCLVPGAKVDRLQAIAAEKRTIPVLYSATNPTRVLVADALVMARDLG